MAESAEAPVKLRPSFAVYPGQWLRSEMVEPHGLSVTATPPSCA